MPLYRTTFERINFGIEPALKQTADVIFCTDVPFDNEHLEQFETLMWNAMWQQNPHWKDPVGPDCLPSGWSSVMGGRKVEKVDENTLLCLAWHIPQEGWLLADGETMTLDPDEAARFTVEEFLGLRKRHPGDRYPMVQSVRVKEVYGPNGEVKKQVKLQIWKDNFVLWGYGPRGHGGEHVELAKKKVTDHFSFDFELPEASAGLPPPQEYERRVSWAWRFVYDSGDAWTLAESQEACMEAAKAEAVENMRSTGNRHCCSYFATKDNIQVTVNA